MLILGVRRWIRTRFPLALGFFAASAAAPAQPALVDPDLEAVAAVTGLNQPVGLAFFGADEYFVIEKASGQVKHFRNGGQVGVVLDLAVNSNSERGLLGIALHPDFPTNPGVYLYWSESSTGADSTGAGDVGLLANRVDRFDWNGLVLTYSHSVLALRAYQADANQPLRGNHNGGVIKFGPDGKLYILIGDAGRRGHTQNNFMGPVPDDQFGGPEPDPAHATGAIYRMNPDGTVPNDNPFYQMTKFPVMDRIYGFGVRNGFGLAFDPKSGRLWTQEHSDDAFDEVNQVGPGYNGGWIQVMGPISRVNQFRQIEMTFGNGTMQQLRWPPSNIATNSITAFKRLWRLRNAVYTDPKFSWKFAVAPGGMEFLDTASLGATYDGTILMGASRTTLLNGYLFLLRLTADRSDLAFSDSRLNDRVADNPNKFTIDESESLLFGTDFGVVTDVDTGPSGRVLLTALDRGTIYEIRRR